MNTYIALLRGINVGGRNSLPMKELATLLEGLGLTSVTTYLASGNVIFQSDTIDVDRLTGADSLTGAISAAIGRSHGFTPQLLIRSRQQLKEAIAANPFPEAESQPRTLHLFFLEAPPAEPDLASLQAIKADTERFKLVDAVFYLHAPDGIGRSKLAARAEKLLGVPATARNWRTVSKVMALANRVNDTAA
jgi:uncharacterized protein (DUF1697 family)